LSQAELPSISYSPTDARAYVAHRLPATYGVNLRIFDEIAKRFPAFEPEIMMDYGSGPGSCILYATDPQRDTT
jgi:ribosomal protein RSM22 (predicted rRNA methylase)